MLYLCRSKPPEGTWRPSTKRQRRIKVVYEHRRTRSKSNNACTVRCANVSAAPARSPAAAAAKRARVACGPAGQRAGQALYKVDGRQQQTKGRGWRGRPGASSIRTPQAHAGSPRALRPSVIARADARQNQCTSSKSVHSIQATAEPAIWTDRQPAQRKDQAIQHGPVPTAVHSRPRLGWQRGPPASPNRYCTLPLGTVNASGGLWTGGECAARTILRAPAQRNWEEPHLQSHIPSTAASATVKNRFYYHAIKRTVI